MVQWLLRVELRVPVVLVEFMNPQHLQHLVVQWLLRMELRVPVVLFAMWM